MKHFTLFIFIATGSAVAFYWFYLKPKLASMNAVTQVSNAPEIIPPNIPITDGLDSLSMDSGSGENN